MIVVMTTEYMNDKTLYILGELWISAWNASVQHSALYKADALKNQRDDIDVFKRKVIYYIKDKLIPQYKEKSSEQRHLQNISNLIAYANNVDTGVLGENGYKYGIAQKLLNLALKYYWCLGEIEEPPHCPVDKIIIDQTIYRGRNWTQILLEKEYLEIIAAIKTLSKQDNCSISEWELNKYARRSHNNWLDDDRG